MVLESLKLIKNLGKQIIIFSHYKNVAKEMIRESDLLVGFQKIEDSLLNKFSHQFERHDKSNSDKIFQKV